MRVYTYCPRYLAITSLVKSQKMVARESILTPYNSRDNQPSDNFCCYLHLIYANIMDELMYVWLYTSHWEVATNIFDERRYFIGVEYPAHSVIDVRMYRKYLDRFCVFNLISIIRLGLGHRVVTASIALSPRGRIELLNSIKQLLYHIFLLAYW